VVRTRNKANIKPIFHSVAEAIGAAIARGELKVGDKLPTQRELGEQFGASRVVIREALRYLEQQGLIIIKRGYGGGTFVAQPTSRPVRESLVALLRTGEISMQDLAEARSIYEPEVARLAALRATDEELAELEEVLHHQEAALGSGSAQEGFDLRFHRVVAKATRNPVLVTAMNAIVHILLTELKQEQMELDDVVRRSIVDFHRRILEALRQRDPDQAYELMARHIADVQRRLARLEVAQQRQVRTSR